MKTYRFILILLPLLYSLNASACWDDDDDDWFDFYDDDWWYDDWDDDDDWEDDDGYDWWSCGSDDDDDWDYDGDGWDDDDDWDDWNYPDDDDDWWDDDSIWLPDVVVTPDDEDDEDEIYDGIWLPEILVTPNGNYIEDDDGWWRGCGNNDDGDDDSYDDSDDSNVGNTSKNTSNSDSNGNVKRTEDIKNAASKAVFEVISKYGTQKPYCNIGVKIAFEHLFNKKDLDGKCANDMVRYWLNNPSSWEKISMSEAQKLANQGYFVVAGWINPTGRSGHVVVVVPGNSTYSSTWGENLPNVMDTGRDKRTTSQPISHSFAYDKKSNVVFFKYK